jgi:probable rRNA maturation factor
MTGATARHGASETMNPDLDPSRAVVIDLAVPCVKWRRALPGADKLARSAARAALARAGRKLGTAELSLVLADDAIVAGLNERWRGRNGPTNVLAFASDESVMPPAPRLLGDVVLAYETVTKEARDQGKALADHLRHLVIHGVLHLLGYDHETAGPARRMESLETRILATLGVPDPYDHPYPAREDAHG